MRLFGAPSDGHYAVAQLVGVLHSEVSQAADSLHADQRIGSDVKTPQRVTFPLETLFRLAARVV